MRNDFAPEDENQDAPQPPPASEIDLRTEAITRVLAVQITTRYHALRPTNGLATDPRYMERQRELRRIARACAEAPPPRLPHHLREAKIKRLTEYLMGFPAEMFAPLGVKDCGPIDPAHAKRRRATEELARILIPG